VSLSHDESQPTDGSLCWKAGGRSDLPDTMSVATVRAASAPRYADLAPARGARRLGASVTPALEAERRFLAYAAHELRGSIALQRTLAEVTLADPDATTTTLREMGTRIVAASEGQQRLLDALLALAHAHHRRLQHQPVDLAATTTHILETHPHQGLTRTARLAPARTTGDPQLIERLIANLITNAIHHNTPNGNLDITTHTTAAGRAVFAITNTGPHIETADLARLFQPFQQANPRHEDGHGLGLTIVDAIATAHNATLTVQPHTHGGLHINVAFPGHD
jgi:signal transduction histidine kinase